MRVSTGLSLLTGVLRERCVRTLALWLAIAVVLPLAGQSVDPTGALSTGRFRHTSTLLYDGRVLIAGGMTQFSSPTIVRASVDIYDPALGFVSETSTMNAVRQMHTATLLRDGRVLIAGGHNGSAVVGAVELFNPDTLLPEDDTLLGTPRYNHTATLLPDGKVLIAGGWAVGGVTASAELYDPATNQFTATGNLNTARTSHTAVLLGTGKVLVAGGATASAALNTAELYDPATGLFTPVASTMTSPRFAHSATLMTNGKVLVAGGANDLSGFATNSANLFDPATNTFTATGNLTNPVRHHTATLLPNGKVVLTGGGSSSITTNVSQLYDPGAGTFTATASLAVSRQEHTATLLHDGSVLISGGTTNTSAGITGIEVFRSRVPTFTATGSPGSPRFFHTATTLPNGKVLVTGGGQDPSTSAELYDPSTGTFSPTGSMQVARKQHRATLLPNGKVLIVGTASGSSAELYDSSAGTFSLTGSMFNGRPAPGVTLLQDGRVLAVGGSEGLASNEIHVPATRTWIAAADANTGRFGFTTTLLRDGRVLITGSGNAEVYDPSTDNFSSLISMVAWRKYHTATLLQDGRVLIAGSWDDATTSLATTEFFNPATDTFAPGPSMATARGQHQAQLLPGGQVLITGGIAHTSGTATAELFDPITNTFVPLPSMTAARYRHRTALLLDGRVLIVGGSGSPSTAELYDPGLGFAAGRRPVITSFPSPVCQFTTLSVSGSGLNGGTEGSSGGSRSSAANAPMLRLQRADGDLVRWVRPSNWTASSYSAPLDGVPTGHYFASIFSNGIPSLARLVEVTTDFPLELGTYPNLTIPHASTRTATPSSQPVFNGTPTVSLTVSGGFTGTASFDPRNGVITFQNAGPNGSYTVTVSISATCGQFVQRTFTLTVAPVTPPANLVATATSTSAVEVSWLPADGAASYRVYRKSGGGAFTLAGQSLTNMFVDPGRAAATAYVYYVTSVDGGGTASGASNRDVATTMSFTDDPLIVGATIVKAVHLSQMRTAVNAVRAAAGLAAYPFTDAAVPGVPIRTTHIAELRTALGQARSSLGLTALAGSTPSSGSVVRALEVTQVRAGVK